MLSTYWDAGNQSVWLLIQLLVLFSRSLQYFPCGDKRCSVSHTCWRKTSSRFFDPSKRAFYLCILLFHLWPCHKLTRPIERRSVQHAPPPYRCVWNCLTVCLNMWNVVFQACRCNRRWPTATAVMTRVQTKVQMRPADGAAVMHQEKLPGMNTRPAPASMSPLIKKTIIFEHQLVWLTVNRTACSALTRWYL